MKIEKLLKKLPTGFQDEADAMDEAALRETIVTAEAQVREVEKSREDDDALAAAREHVKDLAGPYRDAINAQRAKGSYCLHRLEEMGKLGTESAKKGKRRA